MKRGEGILEIENYDPNESDEPHVKHPQQWKLNKASNNKDSLDRHADSSVSHSSSWDHEVNGSMAQKAS